MQSTFLSKSILCMLIINVSLCRALKPAWLSSTICNARCYWTHRGFDYGYYENEQCKCAPPTVYVFDGMGHDLSDEYIETSLDNDNIIESPVTKYQKKEPAPATTTIIDTNNVNSQLWKQIVDKITKEYSLITENDLDGLKSTIIDDASTMRYFIMYLHKPLDNALKEMKSKKPYTSTECDRLLKLLQLQNKKKTENSKVQLTPKPKAAAVVANQITSPAAAQEKPITTNVTQKKTVKSEKPDVENVTKVKSKAEKNPNGNAPNLAGIKETKQELGTSKDKTPKKIFVKMTEEYVDDDENVIGNGTINKVNENTVKPTKSEVTRAKSLTDDTAEHKVNESESGSGSWVSEEE